VRPNNQEPVTLIRIRGQIKPISDGRFAILNAAERLFAQHGYYGASMRDITTLAEVPHGLATYHFSSKDDLFRQVVARRAGALLDGLRDGLREASTSAAVNFVSGQPAMTVRAVITAYVGAHVRFAAKSAEQAWYMRLTQQLIAIGRRRELTGELAEAYQPVADAYLGALAAACPWMSKDGINRRFYMMRLLLAGVLVDVEAVDALGDSESMVERVSRYCAASFLEAIDSLELPAGRRHRTGKPPGRR
jgi:AcrR family transcriptional regulator